MPHVLGIDIGGTGIKGAPVDLATGRLVTERHRIATPQPATPDAVADVVREIVEVFAQDQAPRGIGATFPAVMKNGVAYTAANVDRSWVGADAQGIFGDVVGAPVAVVNDADAAGLAEMRFGAGKGVSGVVIMVTLGTGIGSAVFLDGKLLPNTELGHLRTEKGKDAEKVAAESVREREDLSWKEWAARLHDYFELLETLFSPDLVIVGGGVSKKSDKFLPRITTRTEIVPAQLRNDAGIVGAALAAEELSRAAG